MIQSSFSINIYYVCVLTVAALPIFNYFCIAILGSELGKSGTIVMTVLSYIVSLITAFYYFFGCLSMKFISINFELGDWVLSDSSLVSWDLTFDALSLFMIVVVLIVSSLVHIFSFDYMSEDPNFIKFISYLSLFTFFMIMLVSADNILVLFFGWEGVGLCSYLLIGFWTTRVQAGKASLKALFMNRIGDFFLIFALAVSLYYFKTTDFQTIFALTPYFKSLTIDVPFASDIFVLDFVSILFLLAAVGKSAQLGLHTWLPDAMEGPTPVSALIHAATMVTAGVFLVIRCSYTIQFSEKAMFLMVLFGLLTALFAGFTAMSQWDIKKVVAFSTCSQLGYMFLSCGLGSFTTGFFHLTTHAFFKALLFLTSGYIIHQLSGEQDMRKMGGLLSVTPLSYVLIFVASLSLVGMTGLSGFYSKESIFHISYLKVDNSIFYWVVFFLFYLSIYLTVIYSFRMLYYVFLSQSSLTFKKSGITLGDKKFDINTNYWTYTALVCLIIFSIFFGYFSKEIFSNSSEFFKFSIFNFSVSDKQNFTDSFIEFAGTEVDGVLLFSLISSLLIFYTCVLKKKTSYTMASLADSTEKKTNYFQQGPHFYYQLYNKSLKFFSLKFCFDIVINYVAFVFYRLIFYIFELFDKGLFEVVGPDGISRCVYIVARAVTRFHSGFIHHYLNTMVLSLGFCIIGFYFFLF